jgi:hypothetical protein
MKCVINEQSATAKCRAYFASSLGCSRSCPGYFMDDIFGMHGANSIDASAQFPLPTQAEGLAARQLPICTERPRL